MVLTKQILIMTVVAITTAALSISLPGAFSSGPCFTDGQRYTFNGILLHDMIRDGELLHPYQYNVTFYARYPTTNLPYGPPFFALVFAVAFSIFGISFSVARGVVALYMVSAALMGWYCVYKITHRYWLSILAVAAFLSNPLIIDRARDIGPEIAVVFHSFLTIYFFYHYVEYNKKYFAVYSALALGLGYLTKPHIIPLGIALFLYVLARKKWHILSNPEIWIALFIVIILTVPYTMLTFKYSVENLGLKTFPPLDWNLLTGFPRLLIRWVPVSTCVALIGFIIGIYRKNRLIWLCLLWGVCWYIFHTFLFGYNIGWTYLTSFVAATILPFALVSYETILFLKRVRLDEIFIGLIILWFAYTTLSAPVCYVRGYEDAGKYVADHPRGKSVLFYGKYEGSFMMGVRQRISREGPYILRGDRQLAIRLWFDDHPKSLVVQSPDNVIKLLNKYQTGYVVVEKDMPEAKEYPEYNILLQTLKNSALFKETARFSLQTNYTRLGPELIVYAFNLSDETDKADILNIPVPMLGDDLTVSY
jgi:hypothetical protein